MISIIVPIYNEEKNLRNFIYDLYCLENIKENEVIFVDGGSSDGTKSILEELSYFGYTFYKSDKKGRANQMNYGARLSKGEVLFFLHADSTLPKDTLRKIENSNTPVGCLKIKFDSSSFPMKVNAFISTKRVQVQNIAFGDQGIFLRREIFEKIGGYADLPLMEDYRLSEDITKLGYKIKVIDSYIHTSSRRYKGKTLRTMYLMQKLQKMYRNGEDIEKIAKMYKDIR